MRFSCLLIMVLLAWAFGETAASGCLCVSVSAAVLLFESLAFHGHLEEKGGHLHTYDSASLFLPRVRMNLFLSQV